MENPDIAELVQKANNALVKALQKANNALVNGLHNANRVSPVKQGNTGHMDHHMYCNTRLIIHDLT